MAGVSDPRGARARDANDWHEYRAAGSYAIVVKAIDIFGNDTTKLAEVRDQVSDPPAPPSLPSAIRSPSRSAASPAKEPTLVNGVRARSRRVARERLPECEFRPRRRLLGFWFADEHRSVDGLPFRFYFCQREAVETFIYLTEIEPVRGCWICSSSPSTA